MFHPDLVQKPVGVLRIVVKYGELFDFCTESGFEDHRNRGMAPPDPLGILLFRELTVCDQEVRAMNKTKVLFGMEFFFLGLVSLAERPVPRLWRRRSVFRKR